MNDDISVMKCCKCKEVFFSINVIPNGVPTNSAIIYKAR